MKREATSMARDQLSPALARLVVAAFWLSIAGVLGLAAALSMGLADPRPLGELRWTDEFSDPGRWLILAEPGVENFASPANEGLAFSVDGRGGVGWALAAAPKGDYSIEAGAAQVSGSDSVRHGLVLGWKDARHFTAITLNRDGYVEAYTQAGEERTDWFAWQQWPHVLGGGHPNRLRADVRADGRVEVRINDERVVSFEARMDGRWGMLVDGQGRSGEVVFTSAKLWSVREP